MSKSKPKLNLRDSRTLKRVKELADNVVSAAQRGRFGRGYPGQSAVEHPF